MNCFICKRNLDEIHQDNVSPIPNVPICEDCIKDIKIEKPTFPCDGCSRAEWQELYGALVFLCDLGYCAYGESEY